MSRSRYVSQDERQRMAALARIKKKITGGKGWMLICPICHKGFTDQQILSEDLMWCVGKNGSTQMHWDCFRAEFLRGGVNNALSLRRLRVCV